MSAVNGHADGHTETHAEGEGVKYDEQGRLLRRVPAWRRAVRDFQHAWFAIPMNTGLLSLLFRLQPWQFPGLYILGDIMYVFTLIQFILLLIPLILRYSLYGARTKATLKRNIDDLAMLGTLPIAFNIFANLTAVIPSNAPWGGHAFSILAYTLWWIGTGWTLSVSCIVFIVLVQSNEHSIRKDGQLPVTIFLPIVALATDAVEGASIISYGKDISPQLAVPAIIVCYLLLGVAFWMSIFFYAAYTWRLLTYGWPEMARRPALFLLLGPFGQLASAFFLLAYAVETKMTFAQYNSGTLLTSMSASGVAAASQVLGLLALGGNFFWYFIVIAGVLDAALKNQLAYSLFWWSTIFPTGTANVALIALAASTQGEAFKALSAAWTIFLVGDYILNWVFTVRGAVWGSLLVKGDEFEVLDEGFGKEAKRD